MDCIIFGTGPRLALSTSSSVTVDGKYLMALLRINILGLFSIRR